MRPWTIAQRWIFQRQNEQMKRKNYIFTCQVVVTVTPTVTVSENLCLILVACSHTGEHM